MSYSDYKKYIVIKLDFSDNSCLSHYEVENALNFDFKVISTNCLEFFSVKYLASPDLDIVGLFKNGDYISMRELFEEPNNNEYTKRHIRIGHNLSKLLLSNEFTYKKNFDNAILNQN